MAVTVATILTSILNLMAGHAQPHPTLALSLTLIVTLTLTLTLTLQ